MLGFVFQLSATGVAQSVKIEKQLQSLETVFEQVESHTWYFPVTIPSVSLFFHTFVFEISTLMLLKKSMNLI